MIRYTLFIHVRSDEPYRFIESDDKTELLRTARRVQLLNPDASFITVCDRLVDRKLFSVTNGVGGIVAHRDA